ncbi:MAG: porin [Alphaproteobacteria bacterium]
MVKSKLLASTIIVAAAAAVTAAPVSAAKLKLGGYYEQWIGVGAKGSGSALNTFDVKNDSEINFDFKQKLKNGMTVGGRMELEGNNDATTGFDESSMYISGSFGKIQLGNNDAAAAYVGSVKGVGPVGIIKSDARRWVGGSYQVIDNDNDLSMGDTQKITYFTPKMGSFSGAISYMPDASDSSDNDYYQSETSGISDGVSAMGKFSGKMGSSKYSLAVGYSTVDDDGTDNSGWNVGLNVSAGKNTFTIFSNNEEDGTTDNTDMGVAVMHKLSKTDTVSLQLGVAEKDAAATGSDAETTVITAGYAKKLGGGVSFEGSVFNIETDNDSGTNVGDMGVVGGFKVKF